MKNIVFLGECMLEESDDPAFRFGGDTLNTALYLSRVSNENELTVHYATAIGADYDSDLMLSHWQKENIKTGYVLQLIDHFPGRYRIKTNRLGERRFSYKRKHSAARYYLKYSPKKFLETLTLKRCDYFYFSGISLAILSKNDRIVLFDALKAFREKGGQVIFDNNYRPVLWKKAEVLSTYQQAMSLCDIAFLTDDDEYAIYPNCSSVPDIIERVKGYGISEVIIKQGAKPCVIACQNNINHVFAKELPSEKIVDTSAAGDSFSAGYLAKRLSGESPIQSAEFAHELAARVIQFTGAIIPKKSMSDLIFSHN